jgi:hypothetical protein
MLILRFGGDGNIHTTTSESAAALYVDEESDTLYLAQGTNLKSWESALTNKTATWRGREIRLAAPWAPACVRVVADSYAGAVTLRLYANGVLVGSYAAGSNEAFKIAPLRREKKWEMEVLSSVNVHEVAMGNALGDL